MKKYLVPLCLLMMAIPATAAGRDKFGDKLTDNLFSRIASIGKPVKTQPLRTITLSKQKSDSIYESIRQRYAKGKISPDSVVSLARYHKTGSAELAERCLLLVAQENNPRAMMELGALFAFSPEFSNRASEGVELLKKAAKGGLRDANGYLGLYYYNLNDFKNAKTYFAASAPINFGFANTGLGGMYLTGKGVKKDPVKAREYYHQASLKGYARGMSLYGHNLRTNNGGSVNYPEAFFWLYIAGDLGDDTSRTTLFLPRLGENFGDNESGRDASLALQIIEAVNSGKTIKNDPLYKDGFLASLKSREKAAEQGDDWARFYLGSMNYNGDFLNQNYKQALRYYEPVARNGKLPAPILAIVNERLGEIYRKGKGGVRADANKAAYHTNKAAQYGSASAYKMVEHVAD